MKYTKLFIITLFFAASFLEIKPATPESLYQLAMAYYTGSGHIEPTPHLARQEARKILTHPQATPAWKAKAYFLIGKSYYEELEAKKAIENLSKVHSNDDSMQTETAAMLYDLGIRMFHEKSEQKKRKMEIDDKYAISTNALTHALPFLKGNDKEVARLALGTIFAFGGHGIQPDTQKVIEFVQPVYESPSNPTVLDEARYLLGSAYFYLGAENKDKVIELLTPVAQNETSIYKNIANQLLSYTYFNANDWGNAIIFIKRTLQSPLISLSSTDRSELELMLGKAYYHNGQFDEAELILKTQQADMTWPDETKEEINRILDEIHTIKEFLHEDENRQTAEALLSLSRSSMQE